MESKNITRLDSMRWFSHRRRTGGRHSCVTYLLTAVVAWPTATPATPAMLTDVFPNTHRTQGPRGRRLRGPLPT